MKREAYNLCLDVETFLWGDVQVQARTLQALLLQVRNGKHVSIILA